jgi:hypothetical protein
MHTCGPHYVNVVYFVATLTTYGTAFSNSFILDEEPARKLTSRHIILA